MVRTRLLVIFLLSFIGLHYITGNDSMVADGQKWTQRMKELNAAVPENIDSVVLLANQHLDDCPFDESQRSAYYHSFMAEVFYYKQELSKSLQSYQSALISFQKSTDSTYLAVIYNNIGLIHYLKANFDSALVAYYHSLELEKKANNKEGIAMSYQNLGIIYGKWERYEQVYEYYNNALEIYEELEDYSSIAAVTNNLAVISVRINDLDAGFNYYKKAYEAYRNENNLEGMAAVAANLGRLFGLQGQNYRADEYFDKALNIFINLNDYVGLVHTYSMIGEIHLKNKQVEEALVAYEKAAKYNEKVGLREVRSDNLEDLYTAYKSLGKYQLANEILEKSYALKDSIYDQQQLDKVIELEQKYDKEKHEKELILVTARAERNRLYMWGVSIFFLLLTIIVLIWVNVLKIKERQRRLDMEQKVLRTQMNPHFIFNSLSALQCIIMENNQEDAVDFVADFSTLMRLILQYAKEERITLKKEKEILDKYMTLQNRRFDNKINYKIDFEDSIELSSVLVPPMLTQPFLENAIEHGELIKEDSYIHVHLQRNDDKLEFSIEDNGIGIKRSLEKCKLRGKKHESLAMGLTKERLELMNNNHKNQSITLKVEDLSKYGRHGTRVLFKVPYVKLN